MLDYLPEGGRALVVGHSPTNEAAILGLTGKIVAPLAKGDGALVIAGDDLYRSSRWRRLVAVRRVRTSGLEVCDVERLITGGLPETGHAPDLTLSLQTRGS